MFQNDQGLKKGTRNETEDDIMVTYEFYENMEAEQKLFGKKWNYFISDVINGKLEKLSAQKIIEKRQSSCEAKVGLLLLSTAVGAQLEIIGPRYHLPRNNSIQVDPMLPNCCSTLEEKKDP